MEKLTLKNNNESDTEALYALNTMKSVIYRDENFGYRFKIVPTTRNTYAIELYESFNTNGALELRREYVDSITVDSLDRRVIQTALDTYFDAHRELLPQGMTK